MSYGRLGRVMTANNSTRKVYVVSWVYFNGDEQGGGGFNWYEAENRNVAEQDYEAEAPRWAPDRVRVRLLEVEVNANLTGQALTNFLDGDIDQLEVHLPALRETDTGPDNMAGATS